MITAITIENFKGIRERVKFDFRPITLLFGANSAGKSTVLHALHYAREVFERHNLDADQTIAGGKYIDLGGFEHFINRSDHDDLLHPQKRLRLRIDLAVSNKDLPSFDPNFDLMGEQLEIEFDSLLNEIESTAVELAIGWSSVENCPYVANTTIFFNGLEIAQIVTPQNLRGFVVKFTKFVPDPQNAENLVEVSTLDHPCLKQLGDTRRDESQRTIFDQDTILSTAFSFCGDAISNHGEQIEVSGRGDALPDFDNPLAFDPEPFTPSGIEAFNELQHAKIGVAHELVRAVSDLVLGPCRLVRDNLKQFRYLGPLRDTPPRNFQPPRFPDPSRWSSGLGAWDTLQNGSDLLVDAVGSWLGDPENLNAGCRVERRTVLELDYADPIVRALLSGRAFDDFDEHLGFHFASAPTSTRVVIVPNNSNIELRPHDVGIGISQVVPVIVTALDGSERLLAIEQPELHIHPRLQAEIADLFIEAIHKNKHRFIIETHSEHLILRLLRRIRETEVNKAPADRTLRTDELAIYYLKQENGTSDALEIEVDVKGEFIQPWPDDFFDIDFYERFRTGDEG
ncbi:MAG: AAA family ATPase [Planctomycetaceae bacterium]|nr:AAA family ATPase [Planctomycetaceae bacterium]